MTDETTAADRLSRWAFKKEITLGDILLALSIALPMGYYVARFETRLTVVEEKQTMQSKIDAAQDSISRDSLVRIESQLRDIQQALFTIKRESNGR